MMIADASPPLYWNVLAGVEGNVFARELHTSASYDRDTGI